MAEWFILGKYKFHTSSQQFFEKWSNGIFNRPVLEEYVSQVEGGPTCFSHTFMEHEMAFLLVVGKCIFFLKIWQLLAPQVYKHL
jgi:hypothetical protein